MYIFIIIIILLAIKYTRIAAQEQPARDGSDQQLGRLSALVVVASATFKPKLVGGRFQLPSTYRHPSSFLCHSPCPFHALLPLEAEVRDVSFFILHW